MSTEARFKHILIVREHLKKQNTPSHKLGYIAEVIKLQAALFLKKKDTL